MSKSRHVGVIEHCRDEPEHFSDGLPALVALMAGVEGLRAVVGFAGDDGSDEWVEIGPQTTFLFASAVQVLLHRGRCLTVVRDSTISLKPPTFDRTLNVVPEDLIGYSFANRFEPLVSFMPNSGMPARTGRPVGYKPTEGVKGIWFRATRLGLLRHRLDSRERDAGWDVLRLLTAALGNRSIKICAYRYGSGSCPSVAEGALPRDLVAVLADLMVLLLHAQTTSLNILDPHERMTVQEARPFLGVSPTEAGFVRPAQEGGDSGYGNQALVDFLIKKGVRYRQRLPDGRLVEREPGEDAEVAG